MRFFLIILAITSYSCGSSNIKYIVNEEFDSNKFGWTEEKTEYHSTELIDGELLISSLDTASRMSSNGPKDHSFLWSLPANWKFETSLKIIDGGKEAGFGFNLYSASLSYTFRLSRNGNVQVSEYNYNSQKTTPLIEKAFNDYKLDFNQSVSLRLEVTDSNTFEFFIDDQSLGEGNFRAKSWEEIRLFAESRGTAIKADYYRIQKLE